MRQVTLSRFILIGVLFLLFGTEGLGQVSGPNNRTEPGTPAGSYNLDDLENINYFNGRLHFGLPLLKVGGRGNVQQTVNMIIDPSFPGEGKGCPGCSPTFPGGPGYFPLWAAKDDYEAGYGPGVLEAVVEGITAVHPCEGPGSDANYSARTTLLFKSSDGTEYRFVDVIYDGQVKPVGESCGSNNPNATLRGKQWITKDGSGVTFLSDQDIYDNRWGNGSDWRYFPSGVMKLRDGTFYRIDNGTVTWIRDANGNKISYEYYSAVAPYTFQQVSIFTGKVKKITDPLGRTINFTYDNPTSVATERYDEISYLGFNNQTRTLRVYYVRLEHALREPATLKDYCQLGLDCETLFGGPPPANPLVVSSVLLPNNTSYHFYYNIYAELTRYELPTGGAVEFDYDWGLHLPNFASDTYRRVVERRTYPNGGSGASFEKKTTINKPEQAFFYQNSYYAAGTDGWVNVDHYVKQPNGTETRLSRERHYYNGMAAAPTLTSTDPVTATLFHWAGPPPIHNEFPCSYVSWMDGLETKVEYMGSDGSTVLRTVQKTWQQAATPTWWPGSMSPDWAPKNNPRIVETVTILNDVTPNLISKSTAIDPTNSNNIGFDQYNNPTDTWEYDYGQGTTGALLRHTHTDYVTDSTYTDALTLNGPALRSLPTQTLVYDGIGNLVGKASVNYDETALLTYTSVTGWVDPGTPKRGNPTTTSRWLNTNNTWLATHTQFDQCGNVRKIWDPRDTTLINPMLIEYSETYKFGFATLSTTVDPDLTASANGPGLPQTSTRTYDLATGQVTTTIDPNNVTTTYDYTDPLDRLKRVIQGSNTTAQTQTTIEYDDAGHKVTRTSDKDVFNDNVLKVESLFDGMGRTIENRNYEGGTNFIAVQIHYDTAGRADKSSNPYRQNETPVWTTQEFDALDRVTSVTTPDNAKVTTSYEGNSVTVTDQAGKVRKSVVDALGRMNKVVENPGGLDYETTYLYDALDNLIRVTQGSQQRFFLYDSLKRLIRTRNPEQEILTTLNLTDPNTNNSSWTTGYQYDVAGNLTQKTDPRGVTSTYAYDALNRTTAIDYSDTTPDVKRFYDGATNGKGRFWYAYKGDDSGVNNVEKTLINEYDPLGRPKEQQQLFKVNSVWKPYSISRTYNLAGEVATQTYPSNHTVSYTYDAAGRTTNFSGYLGDGTTQRTYATGISYSVWGAIGWEQFGTNTTLYRKSFYNIRGQLFDTRLSSVNDAWDWNRGRLILYYSSNHQWGQSGTDNNGNVRFAETWIPPENAALDQADTLIEDSYNYDGVNRLTSVAEQRMTVAGGWGTWQQQFGQQYDYDQWGNRTILDSPQTWGTGINKKQFTKDATNRLGVPSGQSGAMAYDKAGNLTNDTYTYAGGGLREYDAENKMTRAQSNGQWQEYTYNADRQRVRRKVNGQEFWQIYGMQGELLAEYVANGSTNAPQKEYGYRNGELLVTATITTGWGATPVLHDNPLGVGTTTVQALHITELRDAINAVRSHLGMAAYSWQTSATTNDFINPSPILEMRTALDQTLGPPANGYSAGLAQNQLVKAVHIQELRDRVLAAWVTGSAVDIRWLVTDQLGTARMVADLSGSLANLNRHDYLPFGEELVAGIGGRTTTQGYAQSDGMRQHFTSYERDTETSLDYAQERYYASVQGRFTSADAVFADQSVGNPQSWNLYVYVRNNPLRFIDPTGFGDYYYADGVWSFSDGIKDDKVYLLIETVDNGTRNLKPQLLNITHTQFKIIANIVRQESGTADPEENLWIAHTANNEAIANRSTLYNTLQSGFSSAPDKSSGIQPTDKGDRANSARAGVLDVLSGGADPTGGARRWDGTDFLAWGLAGPYGSHAKFRQFASIDIPSNIYSTYEAAQRAKWHGNSVSYKVKGVRASYSLPAAVFTDFKNWGGQPCNFHYVTNAKGKTNNLVATGAKGETIFWKY